MAIQTQVIITEQKFIIEIGLIPVIVDGSNEIINVIEVGVSGPQGPQGPQGEVGVGGGAILSGSGVPSSGLGVDGNYYRNLDDSGFWYKSSGSWTEISDFDTVDGGFF